MANLTIKGYTAPTGLGYGTFDDITPTQGILRVETERNIDGGDSARIILSDDTDFTNFETQRAIQIFLDGTTDPDNLIWEGMILQPSLGMHKPWPNIRTYEINCAGYEKFLMRDDITKTWTTQSLNTIFEDIAEHANAYHRFPTVKRFKYDTTKLTSYDADTYNSTITKKVERQKIWDVLKELYPLLSGFNTVMAYEYGLYLDYHQSNNYIYLMPDLLEDDAVATTDFSDDANIYADSKTIKRNWDKVTNYSHTNGDGFETIHYHATKIAGPISVGSNNYNFDAAVAPSARHYLAIVIQNAAPAQEYGSFSIDGYDDVTPIPNSLTETLYLYAPLDKTTTIFSRERYADFVPTNTFNIMSMWGATVDVYECVYGIAGRSIYDYGMCSQPVRNLSLNSQSRVDNCSQQLVRLYHNPVHEAIFRVKAYDKTNYINKTVDLTDDFLDTTRQYLVTKQKYIIPENYDVEQWLSGFNINADWE